MIIQYPAVLLLLWILPAVAWLLVRAERKRTAAARRFVGGAMVPRLMPRFGGARPWIKGSLIVFALAALIVAAARPRFGVYFEQVVRRGVDCFVLLDVSRSMLAEDVAPNRLERAKSDIRDLLKKLAGDRVGLIVFAGKPSLKVPLTTDEAFFRSVLDDVDVRSAPRGGTLIGDAVRKALEAMPPRADHDRVLVVFTDGEDQDSYAVEAAKQAAERGVKIFTVGLGDSAEGARIPLRDASGKLAYLKDDGKEHWSKADQDALREIALATGGAHVPAGTKAYDLGQLYEDHLAGLARGEDVQDRKRKLHRDRFQIFLLLAVVLFAVEMLIPPYARASDANNRRPSTAGGKPRESRAIRGRSASRDSGRKYTVAVKCLLVAMLFVPAQALGSESEAAREVQKGLDAFRGGDFKAAAEAFSSADGAFPDQPLIAFNLGCAFAAEGKHDEAAGQFRAAALSRDLKLAATAHYNLGCLELSKAKARFGARPEDAAADVRRDGIAAMHRAASGFRDALAVDPQNADARYNLEATRLWIIHIEEVWRQRDRDKLRKAMNLMQFLEMLEGRQRELRNGSRTAADLPPSPLRREEIRRIERQQRYLAEEIEPLKEKLAAALAGPPQPGGAAAPNVGGDVQKALSLLNALADDAHNAMVKAADSLASGNPSDAANPQAEAVEKLDQTFMAVAPFAAIVQKAVKTQQGLVGQSKGAAPEPAEKDAGREDADEVHGDKGADWSEAAWNQRFIGGYARILPAKARHELEQLEKTPAPQPATPAAQPATPDGRNVMPEDAAKTAEQQMKQQEEMQRALRAGVELSPKVGELSNEAETALAAAAPADALPRQEEALKLLQEMLPKQEQQQQNPEKQEQNNKQDQDNKDRKNKDHNQQNKDQQQKDKQDKDQDQRNKDRQDKEKQKERQNKDQQQKEQRKQDQSQAGQQQPRQGEMSQEEAEAAMRKARERRQQRKELEKALQERIYRHEKADKDW